MLFELIVFIIVVLVLSYVGIMGSRFYFSKMKKPKAWFPVENSFIDPTTKQKREFSSLFDASSIDLSIIIPAYNESERITVMLEEMFKYLHGRNQSEPEFKWEVIVVSDGSKDDTVQVVHEYERNRRIRNGESDPYRGGEMRVLELITNRGKGGAVRRGMMWGRGNYLLMADADGATQFSDIELLQSAMTRIQDSPHGAVVVGSRAHLAEESKADRAIHRRILSFFFHLLVDSLCVRGVKDTQCGFKLFNRKIARILFPNQHIERWAFDVELLIMAQKVGAELVEVPVKWQEIDGSKLDPMSASIQMAKDLVRMRMMYVAGAWQINQKAQQNYSSKAGKNV